MAENLKIIKNTCGACKFIEKIVPKVGVPAGGNCLRYPPAIIVIPTPQGARAQSIKIGVVLTDWCGEYKTRISIN